MELSPSGDDTLDLAPRTESLAAARPRRPWPAVVAVILLGGVAFLVYQGLNNATLYFRNADQAVAEREALGDRRFRLQGTVVDGSVQQAGDGVAFAVEHDGEQVEVHHLGDPPELFQPGLPVVLEGSWAEGESWFASDRILVKHTNEYKAENPGRVQADAP